MNKENKITFHSAMIVGALIGSFFAILDLAFMFFRMRLSLEEIFLLRTGDFNLSIAFYDFIWFTILGAIVGLLGYAIFKYLLNKFIAQEQVAHMVFCIFIMGSILYGARGYIFVQNHDPSTILYIALFLGIIVFFAFLSILYLILRKVDVTSTLSNHYILLAAVFILILSAYLTYDAPNIDYSHLSASSTHQPQEASHPNILLIVMDTVRADSLSCYNPAKSTTPNIDKVAKEGALFLKAISPAPWTLPSHASIFTGLYPSQHGAGWEHKHLDDQFVTLAEYLREKGYRTVGFSENPFVSESVGLAQGFEDFYPMYGYPNKALGLRVFTYLLDTLVGRKKTREYTLSTVDHFKTWLVKNQRGDKPFFAFINFMAPHLPNYPRTDRQTNHYSQLNLERIEPVNLIAERYYLPNYDVTESDLELMREIYEGDLTYLDSQIGELISFMRDSSVLDSTILVLTSDHGENFGDHGFIEHQFCMYNSLLHVPLIIRYPNKIAPGQEFTDKTSTIFLFQSLVELIGIQKKTYSLPIERRSLFSRTKNRHIYSEYDNPVHMLQDVIGDEAPPNFDFNPFNKRMRCIYTENYKYIWSSNGKLELYNAEEDFHESTNLFLTENDKAMELDKELSSWNTKLWKPALAKSDSKIDAETKSALKSLGYVK